jgi:hypothetical protein
MFTLYSPRTAGKNRREEAVVDLLMIISIKGEFLEKE